MALLFSLCMLLFVVFLCPFCSFLFLSVSPLFVLQQVSFSLWLAIFSSFLRACS